MEKSALHHLFSVPMHPNFPKMPPDYAYDDLRNPGRGLNLTSFRSTHFELVSKSGPQDLKLLTTIEFSQMYHLVK